MRDNEISTREELENALTTSAARKQSRLWKVAEGRVMRWTEILGIVLAVLLIFTGMAESFDESTGAIQIGFGLCMLASILWIHTQRQLSALTEIVRRLERGDS